MINQWTQTLTVDQLEAVMIEHSVPAGRIYTGKEMLEDPHFAAREAIVAVDHPQFGKVRMQAPMPKLSETPSSVRRRAPMEPGEHNAEIYGEWIGLNKAVLRDLAARGII